MIFQQRQTRVDTTIQEDECFALSIFGRLGATVISHPLQYVAVLLEIGHGPCLIGHGHPTPPHILFRKPKLRVFDIFTYMRYIKKVDGFTGLYRGLMPRFCTNLLSEFTYKVVIERLPNLVPEKLLNKPDSELTNKQESLFSHELLKETVANCVQIIVSHPFYIITIRTMAQFVGKEVKYGGLFGSLKEIYHEGGILGFCSGLVPRMMGCILELWIVSSTAFFINAFVAEKETLKNHVKLPLTYLSNYLFYPYVWVFYMLSCMVIVNNCGLQVGVPPNMPIYYNWYDCLPHLVDMMNSAIFEK